MTHEQRTASATYQPRVLLVAYQCGPGMGSVSQIGWEWYARLAPRTPVILATHIRNRPALEAAGAPLAGSQVIYIDTEWFAGPLYALAKRLFPRSEHATFLLSSLDYFPFELSLRHKLKTMLRALPAAAARPFDLIHRVTPVSPAATSRLHTLGVPLMLGPLNGALPPNPGFDAMLRKQDSAWLYNVRWLARLPDRLFGATRHALMLAATSATRAALARDGATRIVAMIENGIDPDIFTPTPWPTPPSTDNPLRIVFVGRLVPFKALDLLLRALKHLPAAQPAHLDVYGEGPMRAAWSELASSLGLAATVTFHGNASHAKIAQGLAACHVFCLPSVRESGGAVLLEAMACARPVLAVAFGGPAEIVDDAVGVAIASDGPEQVERDLANALADVFAHPEQWRARGTVGVARARALYSWSAKVEATLRLYQQLENLPQVATDLNRR